MPESVLSSGWNYQGRCGGWGFQEAQLLILVLLMAFPELATWLPSLMF